MSFISSNYLHQVKTQTLNIFELACIGYVTKTTYFSSELFNQLGRKATKNNKF